MYTDIPWTKDGKAKRNQSNSFVFKVNQDFSLTKFKLRQGYDKKKEVYHSKHDVFDLDYPIAILRD